MTWVETYASFGISGWRSAIFLSFWVIVNAGLFLIGLLEQNNDPGLTYLNDPIGTSIGFSRGGGLGLMVQGTLILLPVCRNIIGLLMQIKFLRSSIPFDKNLHFHKIVAWTMAAFVAVHVVSHCFNFRMVEALGILDGRSAINILWTHPAGFTGIIMLSCMFLMYTSALEPMRHASFEIFWYTHHLAIPFFGAYLSHSFGCFVRRRWPDGQYTCKPYYSYFAALPGLIIYFIERCLRAYRSNVETRLTKIVGHPSDTIEIQFRKTGFTPLTGQYIFLNVPAISKYQWHPFTLSSCPENGFASVHIRIVGDWTRDLGKLLKYGENAQLTPAEYPRICVDGPFGTPTQEVFDYDTVVLIGAGIGVTPFASVLRSIWARAKNPDQEARLKKVHFIWSCRDTTSFEWFADLIKQMEDDLPPGFLNIHMYLTKKFDHHQLMNIHIHHDSSNTDVITNLRSQTRYGRPHLDQWFGKLVSDMALDARGSQQRAGVFFCGPGGLKNAIRSACNRQQNNQVRLRFHAEKF
eukprot:Partr_v1_DN26657_c0_g1_i1_m69449 putative NADPH- oxidase